jgi:iron-sulfur cluster assembly accessory protein
MITKEMTIGDILAKWPDKSQKLAQEMTNVGLHCVGCGAATWETLEAGMLGHGMQESEIESLIISLNEVLKQKTDLTTISLTKRASEKFIALCKEEGLSTYALRFGDQPGGCSGFEYVLDFSEAAGPEDAVFLSHGVEIHVEKDAVSRLIGSEIDYYDGLNGAGFKISNPNVRGSCSCGTSQTY